MVQENFDPVAVPANSIMPKVTEYLSNLHPAQRK